MQAPAAQMMGTTWGMGAMPARPRNMMSMVDAVKTCFQKYFDFTGRASRSEYWWFYLATSIISFVWQFITTIMYYATWLDIFLILGYLPWILYPAILSAGVRRIHDHGQSGWLILVPFYNLYLLIVEGLNVPNIYGPVPTNVPEDGSGAQQFIGQQPMQQQYQQPMQQQYQQPDQQSMQQQYQQPMQQQYQQPMQQPDQQSNQQPMQQQYQQPMQQPDQQPWHQSMQQPDQQSNQQPMQQPSQEQLEKSELEESVAQNITYNIHDSAITGNINTDLNDYEN